MDHIPINENQVDEVLDRALQKIIAEYQPEKVIIFGSYAYGKPDSESDLDLLIIKKTDERPIDRRIAIRTLLRPLRLRPIISPIVVTQEEINERLAMGDPFAEELMKRGRLIYER
jgi:predicted nucleotidyltransferase